MPVKLGPMLLYTTKEISGVLDLTPVTMREYIKSGKMKGQKVGGKWYITEDSLRAFFNGPFQGSQKRTKRKAK